MIIDSLINEFLESSLGQNIVSKLKARNLDEIHFHGITDSAKGFFLSSLIHNKPLKRSILYLANDVNSASNIYYEILNITNHPVFYFPGQEVSPYDQIQSDVETVSHQSKTLYHLLNNNTPCLIITTAKYLLEKIWNKEELLKYCFLLGLNSKIEPLELAKKLITLGYKKTTVVTSRGEFSSRGDIFDVFPIIGEPTRIEFFGDEIESIRIYSVVTQRSQDNISNVIFSPRYYIVDPDIDKIVGALRCNALQDEIEQIKLNTYSESIEYYAQLVDQRQSPLFNYLKDDTLIVIDDWEANGILLESAYQRNKEIKNELEKEKKIIPLKKLLIIEIEDVIDNLKRFSTCYIDRFQTLDDCRGVAAQRPYNDIHLDLLPQERFNNQLELFAEKTKKWTKEKNKIIIFSDQPQRVNGLLKEWDILNCQVSTLGPTNGFKMPFINTQVLTDTEIFGTKRKTKLIHLKKGIKKEKYDYFTNIQDLKINDFVVHVKHGIGKYRGLVKITLDNNEREYLNIEYAADGKLYLPVEQINLLYRYRGAGEVLPRLSKLGGSDWELTKKKVKKAVKRIAEDLLNLYTARSKLEGFAFNPDTHWQIEMEEAFPFTETPDQWKAICDAKIDMESTKPMDRLICGDVGYGKTEVAIRAMFKAVLSGKQVAVLVPTTILAEQHFNVISERLKPYPVKIAMLSRFRSPREQKTSTIKLALGEIDIVIGTHRLLQKDIVFKDLGLVVIDEEQRFGVLHKEKLKQLRVTVDVITLSATPIPRTLYMALNGARDMSLINTPPANRLPIKTFVGEFKPSIIKTAILHELERGGQVYFVHNRIETIDRMAAYLKEQIPEAEIRVAHGRMNDRDLENAMLDFSLNKFNVLVSTTIIESGLDIPNVNTIIINNADQMGLAQLYQLRGRVGRSEIQAYSYCLYPEEKVLSEVSKNRLQAIKEFSTLGSGYQIALRDMEIRGVGNILGPEQHGHMISVGFDLYCELLNEAVDKLRGLEVHDIELETIVDLNITAYIPSAYIENEEQKVIEYKRLATVKTIKELDYLKEELEDRFGKMPQEVQNLLRIVQIKILGNQTSIKSIKSDQSRNVKIEVNFRLQEWLGIHSFLRGELHERTAFKSQARGSSSASSFVLIKTAGLTNEGIFNLIVELLNNLKKRNLNKRIA